MRLAVALFLAALCLAWPARADFRPVVAYSFGGKEDGTFNAAVALGAERFARQTGVAVTEYAPGSTVTTPDGLAAGLEALLAAGADPVVAVGFH